MLTQEITTLLKNARNHLSSEQIVEIIKNNDSEYNSASSKELIRQTLKKMVTDGKIKKDSTENYYI